MTSLPANRALTSHPEHPAAAVAGIAVAVAADGNGGLQLAYRLEGDLSALRLPTPATPVAPDRLWAHTCFEVFLRRGGEAYREYNFSPSGQWAGYAFAAYRQRLENVILPAPHLEWQVVEGSLSLRVTLPAEALPSGDGELHLALTTVVEQADGPLSYWALAHPAGKPDFHHRDGFVLALPDL
jgi:hypothetical protein